MNFLGEHFWIGIFSCNTHECGGHVVRKFHCDDGETGRQKRRISHCLNNTYGKRQYDERIMPVHLVQKSKTKSLNNR